MRFIRIGTLEKPEVLSPDIHIYTESKQPWVVLDGKIPVVEKFYDIRSVWSEESLERYKALLPRIEEYKASLGTEKAKVLSSMINGPESYNHAKLS